MNQGLIRSARFRRKAGKFGAEIRTVELQIDDLRRSLEIEIRSGPQSLNKLSVTAERNLRDSEARTASLIQKLVQAEADAALVS